MKKYENPVIDIEKFNIDDVITASGSCEWDCDDGIACTNGTTPASL